MAASDDLKQHALSSQHDFYDLLGIVQDAGESEIRKAYRRTALKYHPDKVGPNDTEALDKFHLLQIAYDVLLDEHVRALYDNARRARQEKKVRDEAFEGRRRAMKEDLERREAGYVKRKREEDSEELAFQRELDRIAEDGKRRRRERQEQLSREAMEEAESHSERYSSETPRPTKVETEHTDGIPSEDRSVTLRFARNDATSHIDAAWLQETFADRFGPVEDVLLRERKVRVDGEKHRQLFTTVVLVFESIVGAHKCISDLPDHASKARVAGDKTWGSFEAIGWATGQEPHSIPKTTTTTTMTPGSTAQSDHSAAPSPPLSAQTPSRTNDNLAGTPATAPSKLRSVLVAEQMGGPTIRKVTSFSSLKAGSNGVVAGTGGLGSVSGEDVMMMRLKNAQKKREEERKVMEQAAAS